MNRRDALLGWILVIAGFTVIGAGWAGVQSTPPRLSLALPSKRVP